MSSSDSRAVEGKDLWAVWHEAFAFEETQIRSFGKSLQDPRWPPLVSIIPSSAWYQCNASLHDICMSLVAPRDSSVLHLLMEAGSNTSSSLMLAEMVVVLRIPGHRIPLSLSLEKTLTTCGSKPAEWIRFAASSSSECSTTVIGGNKGGRHDSQWLAQVWAALNLVISHFKSSSATPVF